MRQKLIFVSLFFTLFYGNSQQFSLENLRSDEQIEVALDSSYLWMRTENLKVFIENYIVIDEAIDLSGSEEFRARFDSFKAVFYYFLYDFDKSNIFLDKAFDFYKSSNNKEMLVYLYNLKGLHAFNIDVKQAIKWNEKAIAILDKTDEKVDQKLIDLYFNLAVFYYKIKNWEASYSAASSCIELVEKDNIKERLRRMYFHKGIALFHMNDINGAIKNFKLNEDLVKIAEAETGEKVFYKEAQYLYGLSEVCRVLGDYKKSTKYIIEYNNRMNEKFRPYIRELGIKIKKNSDLLVDVARKNEEKAQNELKKTELLYNYLLIGVGLLIITGLIIFIFQQREHQKLNIKKNNLLKSKNREVENALKVKTDFLNSITHELRTPLYAINSITSIIKESDDRYIDPTQIDILSFSGDHLLRFINDVIDFNKGNNSIEFQKLNIESCDLKTLLFNIKKTIKFSLGVDNKNNYYFNIDNAIPNNLEIDTLKLSRIIINLLNNASKNTHNGKVTLSVMQLSLDSKSSVVEFSVKDTGIGISKRQLEEIYLAFNNNLDLVKRIDKRASGLGLGLVMVNRLLKLHKSELVINTEQGIGTTMKFFIKFDIVENSVPQLKPDLDSIKIKSKQIHMLIVDDNKINQMVTSKVVKKEGFTCDIVGGGNEAIELLKKNNNYDFILMDIMMPGMDGFETAKRIQEFFPEQKIIALTAMSIGENRQRFLESGFVNVIEKPFIINNFNTLIHSLIA